MHFDVESRTIFKCRHGSHAYGLNVATSDEDFKGVCIKPKECYFGFTQRFEQMEHMGSKSDGVECKPTNLQDTVLVQTKARAAQEFCNARGFQYEMIDPKIISWNELSELEQSGAVKLTERTKAKLNANNIHSARTSGLW